MTTVEQLRPCVLPPRLVGDEQLARLIATGDREAFAALYDRYLPALVRYCRGILLVREDAEDAAQNAMVAALRALPTRPPQLALRAWLYRVAHNEAISLMRRRHQHEPLERAAEIPGTDIGETAAVRARLRQLVSDLRSLPERQRGALVMRELCGLGYDEIAGALGSSEGTAMQTVFEARSALMHCESGRTLGCEGVQRIISDGDRRSLRARRVRAHMRSCDGCRAFEMSVSTRTRDLSVLVPIAAGKAAIAALLGALGLGGVVGRARLAGLTVRVQSMTPGFRGAAASVVVAVGGLTATQLVHHHQHSRLGHRAPIVHVAAVSVGHGDASAGSSKAIFAITRRVPRRASTGQQPSAGPVLTATVKHPALPRDMRVVTPVLRIAPRGGVAPAPQAPRTPPPVQAARPSGLVSIGVPGVGGVQVAAGSSGIRVAASIGGTQANATAAGAVSVSVSAPGLASASATVAGLVGALIHTTCLSNCR